MKVARMTVFGPDNHSAVEGVEYPDDHRTVVAYPEWFDVVPAVRGGARGEVESATAAPGEKRSTVKPKAK